MSPVVSKKAKQFQSNDNISPDIFKNKWLNYLTRTHVAIPVVVFFIYAAGLLYYTFEKTQLGVATVIGLFFGGILFFTFIEYVVHRWVYHPPEDASEGFKEFTYKAHGIHHDYPKDKQRLAMPPWLSALVATILLLIFELILSQYAFSFLAGFLVGYALYLLVHYSTHIFKMPDNFMKALWINHMRHHYSKDEILFGVSSPLWDYIFGTMPKEKFDPQKKVEVSR